MIGGPPSASKAFYETVLAPLGFGNWQAASSLITGVNAKEIVVGTMGEIYAPKKEEEKSIPPFVDDLKEVGVSFGKAVKESIGNVTTAVLGTPWAYVTPPRSWGVELRASL